MTEIRIANGSKVAKIKVTIVGKIEIEEFEDMSCIEDVLDTIRQYGEAEVTDTEIVVKK